MSLTMDLGVQILLNSNGSVEVVNHPLNEHREKVQAFFEVMATETRKPHFGDMQRGWMMAVLTRAQEAKLYVPKENA